MPIQDYLIDRAHLPAIAELSARPHGLDARAPGAPRPTADQTAALNALRRAQARLINDAQAFFAALPPLAPRAEPEGLEDATLRPAALHLTALMSRQAVVAGSRAPHGGGLAVLSEALSNAAPPVARTLYVAGMWADWHQNDLDEYNASPDSAMPPALRQHIAAHDAVARRPAETSLWRLIDTAHRRGMRLMAIDCAATASLAAETQLGLRLSNQVRNYFAYQIVRDDPQSGRWLAWMEEKYVNRFEDVPGLAELTGAIGLRLPPGAGTPAARPLILRADRGEGINRPSGEYFWVKADLLLTPNPLIDPDALPLRLSPNGACAVLARPDIGENEYELHHHAVDPAQTLKVIQSDGHAFVLALPNPGDWHRFPRGAYPTIPALIEALRAHGWHDVWPGTTPVLDSAASRLAAERRPGLLFKPDAPLSPRYALSAGELAWHLRQEQAAGAPSKSIGRNDPGGATSERLLRDASLYFQLPPQPQRPPLPAFAPNQSMAGVISQLLARYPGVIIGHGGGEPWGAWLLAEQMAALPQHGVRTLFVDTLRADQHQALLDGWTKASETPMPDALRHALTDHLPPGQTEAVIALLSEAHRHGIAIIAADCFLARRFPSIYTTALVTKYYAALRIDEQLNRARAQALRGRWVALLHTVSAALFNQLFPDLAVLTGAVSLRLSGEPHSVLPDLGGRLVDEHGRGVHVQMDLIAANRPPMPTRMIHSRLQADGDYALIYAPDALNEAFELHYYDQGRVTVKAIRWIDQGWHVNFPDEPALRTFTSLSALMHALARRVDGRHWQRNVWADAMPQPIDTLPQTQRALLQGQETVRQQHLDNFEHEREAALLHQVFFATRDQRTAFKEGKALWQAGLALIGLDADAPLDVLKQTFAAQWRGLPERQQGAVLGAIDERQAERARALTDAWFDRIMHWRLTAIRRIEHNRYLAATEHRQGLCAGLTAHFAAAWLLDARGANGNAHFNGYLDMLRDATHHPESPRARILDTALLAWQFGSREQAFGPHQLETGLSLNGVLDRIDAMNSPAAFALSLGNHALLLAKAHTHYLLADPNFARCKIDSRQKLAEILQWHGQLLRGLFTASEPGDPPLSFGLCRYRDDLPAQPLVNVGVGEPLDSLILANLCQPAELANLLNHNPLRETAASHALVRRLTIMEYRQRLTPIGLAPVLARQLLDILAQHGVPQTIQRQLRRIAFINTQEHHTVVTLEAGENMLYTLQLNHHNDVAAIRFLRSLNALGTEIGGTDARDWQSRIREYFWPPDLFNALRLLPQWEVDRQVLAAPLPDDTDGTMPPLPEA